jgi:Leucine-rich repeat (LRR) protein
MASKLKRQSAESALAKARAVIQWREAGYPFPTETRGPWLDHLTDELESPPPLDTLILAPWGLTTLPPEISSLKGVEFLFLQYNQLATIDTKMIAGLGLTSLMLTGNPLQSVPASLFDIDSLQDVYLNDAQLTTLPLPSSNLERLAMLNLSNNPHLTLPKGFLARLPNLKSLMLDGYAHADVPAEVLQLTQLKQLTFDHSKISALPDAIATMTGLRQLSLEHAQLTSLPKSLATMSGLAEAARKLNFMGLKLQGNPFADKQLRKIAKLKNPARTEQAMAWAAEFGSVQA